MQKQTGVTIKMKIYERMMTNPEKAWAPSDFIDLCKLRSSIDSQLTLLRNNNIVYKIRPGEYVLNNNRFDDNKAKSYIDVYLTEYPKEYSYKKKDWTSEKPELIYIVSKIKKKDNAGSRLYLEIKNYSIDKHFCQKDFIKFGSYSTIDAAFNRFLEKEIIIKHGPADYTFNLNCIKIKDNDTYIKRFLDIPDYDSNRIVMNKEFLEKEYLINKKSIGQLARELKKSNYTIDHYLKMYNIPKRGLRDWGQKDFTGQIFGQLTIDGPDVEYNKTVKYTLQKKWLCTCSCGAKVSITQQTLTNKRFPNKSCGHARISFHKEMPSCHLYDAEKRAFEKGWEFNLTSEYIWALYLKQNKSCALTGLPIQFKSSWNAKDGKISLDRIDSKKGYIMGNVQWVHPNLNTMKMDFHPEDFLYIIKLIYDKHKLKDKNFDNYIFDQSWFNHKKGHFIPEEEAATPFEKVGPQGRR